MALKAHFSHYQPDAVGKKCYPGRNLQPFLSLLRLKNAVAAKCCTT